jgi:hypothetical protein
MITIPPGTIQALSCQQLLIDPRSDLSELSLALVAITIKALKHRHEAMHSPLEAQEHSTSEQKLPLSKEKDDYILPRE